MKRLLLFLSFIQCPLSFCYVAAQTSRVTTLQNAHNLTITMTNNQVYRYLVSADQTYMVKRGKGQITIAGDTYNTAEIRGMRFVSLPRFSLNEDSTAISGSYAVDHGLLAFRRSFNVGKWNTIVVPFSLTGTQLRDAFGDDMMLAKMRAVTEGDVATVEFETIDVNTTEVALQAGVHYLIRPTRQPDISANTRTSQVYGSGYVSGPVYVIPNVTLNKGLKSPANQALRSTTDNVRVRMKGTYVSYDGNPISSSQTLFYMNDEGLFAQSDESVAVKAFRSWLEQARNNNNLAYRFYIDGIGEDLTATAAINDVLVDDDSATGVVYDLSGRRVNGMPKAGIYVINGKKVIRK